MWRDARLLDRRLRQSDIARVRRRHRVGGQGVSGALAVLALSLAPTLARAQQETCIQCKHADCLKSLIAQKESIAAGYDRLAAKWGQLVLVEGQPAYEIDFRTLNDDTSRSRSYVDLVSKHDAFLHEANDMASAIGPPPGCGLSGPLEVETNSLIPCSTNMPQLRAAQASMPCKEIGDLLDRHEAVHRQACEARLRDGAWTYVVSQGQTRLERPVPNRMLTPAGTAREEAGAYRMEVAALKDLYKKALATCRQTWYLHFELDVTGKARTPPGYTTTSWTVRQIYTGDVELSEQTGGRRTPPPDVMAALPLMPPDQIMSYMKNLGTITTWRHPIAGALQLPIDVDIDDVLETSVHDPGEGDSFEDTKTTHTWKGKAPDAFDNAFRLEVDDKNKTYNVWIPVATKLQTQTIKDDTTQVIDRSRYGYGYAPTHETPPPVRKMLAPSALAVPGVAVVVVGNVFHHEKDRPFEPKDDQITFDSGDMKIDSVWGLLQSLPGAKANLRVRVNYTLSRKPPRPTAGGFPGAQR
jgi:hypothetical protein